MEMNRLAWCTILAMAWSSTLGCGSAETYKISGTVTLDGRALPRGDILFVPAGGGNPVAGKIEEGKFLLRCGPGKMRVEIRSAAAAPPSKQRLIETGQPVMEEIRVPARYNSATTLAVEVPSPDGKSQCDFALQSKE
jgi:hypothetical protein